MSRVYVSGSIRDLGTCSRIMRILEHEGHEITHDWTTYKGPKDNCDEAERQLAGVFDCEVLLLVVHPRLKAGWMEFGAAAAHRLPVLVVPHDEVSPSMWFSLPNVHLMDDSHSLDDQIRTLACS